MFTAPLRSNERGPDHRKHRCPIVARVRFCWNVFTELLPSNKIFWLPGVMSKYVLLALLETFGQWNELGFFYFLARSQRDLAKLRLSACLAVSPSSCRSNSKIADPRAFLRAY
jgi:hypothetical protein